MFTPLCKNLQKIDKDLTSVFSVGSAEVAPLGFACALVFHVWHICHPIQHTILYISRLRLVIPSLLLPEAMQPLVPYTSLSAPLRYHSFFFLFSFPLIPLFFLPQSHRTTSLHLLPLYCLKSQNTPSLFLQALLFRFKSFIQEVIYFK